MNQPRFKNQVVWITGASSGIGEALAYAFNRAGAQLILSARREPELERVKANCAGDASRIFILPLDLNDLASLNAKAEQALSAFGHIDILVNNGGVGQGGRAFKTPLRVDEYVMNVNYFGHVALTKAVLPAMLARRAGHIVVVGSVTGHIAVPRHAAYSASKHALEGFFNALRGEVWQHHVKVTLVCPGFVKTNIGAAGLREDGNSRDGHARGGAYGMSAEACAREILEAIAKGKEEVFPGGFETHAVWFNRLFPRVVSFFIKRLPIP